MGRISFTNDEYYHVFNRGVDKRDVFCDEFDYYRFLKSLKEFNQLDPVVSLYIRDRLRNSGVAVGSLQNEKLVDIISYCLIPNHFHLILKQLRTGGISEFIKRIGTGYTGYFNHKYERSGVLFQGKFKAVHIKSQDKLLFLSAYVNGNYIVHNGKDKDWIFSSMQEYLKEMKNILCNTKIILHEFKNRNDYYKYALEIVREINKTREEMRNYFME